MKNKTRYIVLVMICLWSLPTVFADNDEQNSYQPVDISSDGIPGFTYPTPESVIDGWINTGNTDSIYTHAWNLWMAINKKTNEVYDEDTLLVWETWHSLEEIVEMVQNTSKGFDVEGRTRAAIQIPRQMLKFDHLTLETADDTIFESVKYSPASAEYALMNKIFLQSTLDSLYQAGAKIEFPDAAMNIKPVFKIIADHNLDESGLFPFKAWTGPPELDTIPFPQSDWSGCVYVDPQMGSSNANSVDTTCGNPGPQNTYYLNDFIYYRIDSTNVAFLSETYGFQCEPGDYAILVGMHMTTREITRWTWETFWWTPDPMAPAFPSLPESVSTRPAGLTGAAAHYAVSTAYQMVIPAQPLTGGLSYGDVLYSYNPYLEPPFDDKVLDNHDEGYAEIEQPGGQIVVNKVGIRTNCMSCHAQAHWAPTGTQISGLGYLGDSYVDMGQDIPMWQNALQADFAWSVVDNIIDDVTAIKDISSHEKTWSFYPNPANNTIYFNMIQRPLNPELRIYNLSGRLMKSKQIDSYESFQMSLETFAPGIYLLKLDGQTQKLIVR